MAMTTAALTVEEKKRLVRRLAADGRGFAEEYGFRVTNNPASLFQVLVLSVLLAQPGDGRCALRATRALRDAGGDSAARLSRSRHEHRSRVLRDNGLRDPDALAALFGDLASTVVERYRGDLRRLRALAHRDPTRERELLAQLPGVDGPVVELFLREAQVLWREVAPVVDRRALAAARRLGLGRTVGDLVGLAGSGKSERLAWLVGALARIDLEKRYAERGR